MNSMISGVLQRAVNSGQVASLTQSSV